MTEEQRRLRALMRHREDLLQTQGQQLNRLRDTTDELVRASLQTLLEAITKQLESVERSVKAHLAAHAELHTNPQLLTTIVGIGTVTAAKLLAEFSDLAQYESAKAEAADAGLTPSQYELGTSARRRSRMSKIGKAGIRAALYWPAITAITHCPTIKAFAEQLAKHGKPKELIIGAVMRKLVHICYGVLKHRTTYDPATVLGGTAPTM